MIRIQNKDKIKAFEAPDKVETGQDYDDEPEDEEEEDEDPQDLDETMDVNGKK